MGQVVKNKKGEVIGTIEESEDFAGSFFLGFIALMIIAILIYALRFIIVGVLLVILVLSGIRRDKTK